MEFALVAPVLFLIIFASIEISRMYLLQNIAQDAAYDAARYAMVEGATTQDAVDKANESLSLFAAQGATVVVNNGSGIDNNSATISVRVTIPMKDNAFFLTPFYQGRNIETEMTIKRERYKGFYNAE